MKTKYTVKCIQCKQRESEYSGFCSISCCHTYHTKKYNELELDRTKTLASLLIASAVASGKMPNKELISQYFEFSKEIERTLNEIKIVEQQAKEIP